MVKVSGIQFRSCLSPTDSHGGVFAPSPSSRQEEARSTDTIRCAVINVDGVAAGILSAPKDVYALPDCKNSSAVAPVKCDVGTALHSEISVALVCDGPMPCNKILTFPEW